MRDRARTICGSGASSEPGAIAAINEAITQAKAQLGGKNADLAFVFASPRHALAEALGEAKRRLPRVDVVACTTAGEITERGLTRGGVSVMLVGWGEAAHLAAGRGAPHDDIPALAQALGGRFLEHSPERAKHAACVLLGDGLSPAFEKLVLELRKSPRHRHPIVGGGAGDDGRFVSTAVAVNQQVFRGGMASVQITSAHPWGVGVAHGLTPTSARMTVTKAKGNVVLEIDERPALDVYRDYAKAQGLDFDRLDLPQFLVENELGVLLFEDVVRVRAPLRVLPEGALFVAGEVPEGSTVCLVRGSQDDVIVAARSAAEDAKDALGSAQTAGILLFSCVCRGMVLGPRYAEEIAAIRAVFPDVPIAGFSSYGEVARTKSRLDGYHNNTIVVAAIPE
ncbi:MAG: FIST C-terminal domain-containing protein [Myxococcales bacterium]|nr:FIST C-terminal domain-containing protein [Myxococcales bacterium]